MARHYKPYPIAKGTSRRTCRRTIGDLLPIDEANRDHRVVIGRIEVARMRQVTRDVHSHCFPSRGSVQIEIHDYFSLS
jgi:hypothetical protein